MEERIRVWSVPEAERHQSDCTENNFSLSVERV